MNFPLPDVVVNSGLQDWMPLSDGVEFKLLRCDFSTGTWTNLIRIQGGGEYGRHRHTGGAVTGYCLEGTWRYRERDWVAVPGSLVYEPPGDVHTLIAGEQGMTTLFVTAGVVEYIDEADLVYRQDTIFSRYQLYIDYCESQSVEPMNICF